MLNHKLFCISKDDKLVYFDPSNSHAATHFADTPNLQVLVKEILENREVAAGPLWFDVDMGRIVGTSDVVEVDKKDELVYAIRNKRFEQGLVPWVKTKSAAPCSLVSVTLEVDSDLRYTLQSAYIGSIGDEPPFPQEPHATKESIPYWNRHAFVWGSQDIEPGTETKVCPW